MKPLYFVPVVLFLLLALVFNFALDKNPQELPSPFIGKTTPAFEVPILFSKRDGKTDHQETISTQSMLGKIWVMNVFASWCVACRAEHDVLTRFIEKYEVETVGLNYKDYKTEDYNKDVLSWLDKLGNPYSSIAVDTSGQVGIDWGVYGVPETFVIDKKGIIRHKFIGPLTDESVKKTLVPLIQQLRREG